MLDTIPCDMVRISESMVTLNGLTYVFVRMIASGPKQPPHTRCDLTLRNGKDGTVVASRIRDQGRWTGVVCALRYTHVLEEGRDATPLPGSSPRATCFMANGKLILRSLLCHYIMYLNRELYET